MWLVLLFSINPLNSCSLFSSIGLIRRWCVQFRPPHAAMGAGGSSGSRTPPATEVRSRSPRPRGSPEERETVVSIQKHPHEHHNGGHSSVNGSAECRCPHRENSRRGEERNKKRGDAALERTPDSPPSPHRHSSIDEEIEEIVANTNDLRNGFNDRSDSRGSRGSRGGLVTPNMSDIQSRLSPNVVLGITERPQRTSTTSSTERKLIVPPPPKVIEPIQEDNNPNGEVNTIDMLQEVDFAKFKKANNRGPTFQRHGKVIHQENSDLLWRLGLVSPEGYTIKTSTRSVPDTQGQYLKPPSYDLSEEQLMATIEKEFAEVSGAT